MARRPTGRTKKTYSNKGLERWFPMMDTALLLLGVASVLSFSYLAWIIVRGDLAHPLIGGTQLDVIKNGVMAGQKALTYSLWLLLIVALVRHYKADGVGYLAMVGGLACWIGMPLLVAKFVPTTSAQTLQDMAVDVEAGFHGTGVAIFVVGLLRVALGRIIMMTYQPSSATTRYIPGQLSGTTPEPVAVGGHHSIMRKCWELHFCRGSVRTTCPRYMEAVACWRRKSGCYCDHDLASRLMASVGGNQAIKLQVAEELETQQRRAQQVQMKARQQPRSNAVRRLCRECPIYLEHQKFKYRALSWLAYPITVLIVAVSASSIRAGYTWADERAAKFVDQYNFIPRHLMDHPISIVPWLNAENFALVIIGIIVLAIMLQTIEAAVFRFKL